ncbi:MAG: aminotransferase class V-fold PLP-dependent enzyme [Gemmatimonadales bacterium]
MTALLSQRKQFDIPEGITYLNCAYMSPLSRATLAAGEIGLRGKQHPWTITPPDFFSGTAELRGLAASIMGATPADIALVPSASYGIAVAAANLPLQRGQEVLVLAEAFPSMVYAWQEAARTADATVVTVPRPSDDDWTSAVLAHITDRTAVASLPQCHWTDGGLLDLAAIGARLREVGGALVVDATQSLGAMPLDVTTIQPDFLVAAGYKWLLGPYSLGYLYAAPHRQHGRPLEHNWIGRDGSEDFAGLTRYRDTLQAGARRYDVGETSNFILVPMAIAALRELTGWGVGPIHDTVSALAEQIARDAEPLGLRTVPRARRAGHYLGLRSATPFPAGLVERLAAERIYVSVRGHALRVTPHLYNTPEDGARLVSVLREVLRG